LTWAEVNELPASAELAGHSMTTLAAAAAARTVEPVTASVSFEGFLCLAGIRR
jgi:hypothetical protein